MDAAAIFPAGRRSAGRSPPDRRAEGRAAAAASAALPAQHVRHLDGWRGVCILLVLVGHFVPGCWALGGAGVEFFFVLSGVLMARVLVEQRQPVPRFLMRRVARVVPALVVYVLAAAAYLNICLLAQGRDMQLAGPMAALFFYHNYLSPSAVSSLFEHCWSLAVEEHSYLLLAALVVLARRVPGRSAALAAGAALLSVAVGWWMLAHPPAGGQFVEWRSEVRARLVLIGFAACILLRPQVEAPAGRLRWLVPAAILVALAWFVAGGAWASPATAIFTALAAMAVSGLGAAPAWLLRLLEAAPLVRLGALSFSLYLWQQLFFSLTRVGLPAPVGVALTFLCAGWCFRRVEQPARAWLNARAEAWRPFSRWGRADRARSPSPR